MHSFCALALTQTLNSIRAHDAPIRCLALSADGTLLATASATGTIVRVFALPSGLKLKTFRRGSRPAGVWAMAFDATAARLCVCSDAASAHVFAVRNKGGGRGNEDGGSSGSTCIAASGAEPQYVAATCLASSYFVLLHSRFPSILLPV